MIAHSTYDEAFFSRLQPGAVRSAREIVPTLLSLVKPSSVVDVGCGTGAWLSVFRLAGVTDILGIDGSYVDVHELLIPPAAFRAADVGSAIDTNRRFDLVLSLEVGEHLPEANANAYMDNLTSLGNVIAFSAAVPGQGGTAHLNEQWPEYWKALFEVRGYKLVDCLRHRFWDNPNIDRWYRQNLLLYVEDKHLHADPVLSQEFESNSSNILAVVHPSVFLRSAAPKGITLRRRLGRMLERCFGANRHLR